MLWISTTTDQMMLAKQCQLNFLASAKNIFESQKKKVKVTRCIHN